MPRSYVVNPTSPDGLPAATPPLNADGEIEFPEVEYDAEDDYDYEQIDAD
jgi:hypothetical protein